MKLKKLVLKGYKSVKLEESLLVDDRVTILIGANDHGKSNLLNAIWCLNDDTSINAEDRNWDLSDSSIVEIEWHFTATEEVLQKLTQLGPKAESLSVIQESLASPAVQPSTPQTDPPVQPQSPAQTTAAPQAQPSVQPAPAPEGQPSPQPTSTEQVQSDSEPKQVFPINNNEEIVFSRDSVTNKVKVVELPVEVPISNEQNVLALRPLVQLFESPSGNVIDQVSLLELEGTNLEFMQGIFRLAGIWDNRGSIFSQTDRTSKLLDEASTRLTKILNDEWNQGRELKWKFEHTGTNGDHIVIKIQDPAIGQRYSRPSLRSSGFRTYFLLSMIIYARTKNKKSNSNIYLFDEPGTYLHPSAQLDLQRSFEAIADQAQIIYTTHSLFLVSKNYPERNRVISKTRDGTKIDQKPYTKNWKSVRESLGILLSNNFLIAEKTLLVEGPSDVIYLLDTIRKLKNAGSIDIDLNDLSIVDAGDSQNFLAMAKIMLSEGRTIVALLDGDSSGKNMAEQLGGVCSAEIDGEKLSVHVLPGNKSSEDVFADLDTLKAATRKAYEYLVNNEIRISPEGFKIEDQIKKIAPDRKITLGRVLNQETKTWFDPPDQISKLLIATLYEDISGRVPRVVPKGSAIEIEKIKKLLSLRGEKSDRLGIFVEAK